MVTALGKQLRIFRIKNGELLKDMAQKLNVTPAYLSSIENGKRAPTKSLISQLFKEYDLTQDEKQTIINAYFESIDEVQISINQIPADKKELGLIFARRFDSLSKEQINQIINILNSEEEN